MKNVLFIGDLRSAYNYGAIGTTETLVKLIEDEHYDIDMKYIDCRSLYHPTPPEGFGPIPADLPRKTALQKMKDKMPARIKEPVKMLLGKKEKPAPDFVPYKYTQYEAYFERMQAGKSLQFEKRMLEWADVVYINGEGNIVNGTDRYGKYRMGARYILFMAWAAKAKYGKPTLIANHTVDPNNVNAFEMISAIYPLLDEVLVRETLSLPLLEQHGVRNAVFVPDALWAYRPTEGWQPSEELKKEIDFSRPYVCLGDSSGIHNAYNKVKWDVPQILGNIVDELRKVIPQVVFVDGYSGNNTDVNRVIREKNLGCVNLHNCSYHDLYHVLRGASLFVSGRWHASILSALACTPVLLWGSDSHKTRSLYTLLDYPYRFFEVSTLPANIEEMIAEARKIIADSPAVKQNMREKSETYARLAVENAKILKKYVD